jgi:hypothetical protein
VKACLNISCCLPVEDFQEDESVKEKYEMEKKNYKKYTYFINYIKHFTITSGGGRRRTEKSVSGNA